MHTFHDYQTNPNYKWQCETVTIRLVNSGANESLLQLFYPLYEKPKKKQQHPANVEWFNWNWILWKLVIFSKFTDFKKNQLNQQLNNNSYMVRFTKCYFLNVFLFSPTLFSIWILILILFFLSIFFSFFLYFFFFFSFKTSISISVGLFWMSSFFRFFCVLDVVAFLKSTRCFISFALFVVVDVV